MQGGISWMLTALLAVALAAAAFRDWRSRTIPNWLNGAIAVLAIPFWWATGLALWPDVALHVAVAAALFALFAIKLLLIMSVAGGVLTIAMLIPHRMAKAAGQPEIPYGIAIAFAGFWLISERILNQFV
jgi:prepilin peptidase CpaA